MTVILALSPSSTLNSLPFYCNASTYVFTTPTTTVILTIFYVSILFNGMCVCVFGVNTMQHSQHIPPIYLLCQTRASKFLVVYFGLSNKKTNVQIITVYNWVLTIGI